MPLVCQASQLAALQQSTGPAAADAAAVVALVRVLAADAANDADWMRTGPVTTLSVGVKALETASTGAPGPCLGHGGVVVAVVEAAGDGQKVWWRPESRHGRGRKAWWNRQSRRKCDCVAARRGRRSLHAAVDTIQHRSGP